MPLTKFRIYLQIQTSQKNGTEGTYPNIVKAYMISHVQTLFSMVRTDISKIRNQMGGKSTLTTIIQQSFKAHYN